MRFRSIAALAAVLALSGCGGGEQEARAGKVEGCDRACLIGAMDGYIAALVAHDPTKAPLDATLKTVENTTAIEAGEGLWGTASEGPTRFKIYVADAAAGQVGLMGVMKEGEKPVLVALRLKLNAEGGIVEAEHLIARDLQESGLVNLQEPRAALLASVPEAERMPREELIRIGLTYYDALDLNNGSLTPFADDCVRRENGLQTTSNALPPPDAPQPEGMPAGFAVIGSLGCAAQLDTQVMSYITSIDRRRVEVADVETGLVLGFSHFRHDMTEKEVKVVGVPGVEAIPMSFDPFDLPAAHIYKVTGGKMHEIEAMGYIAPHNIPTGWE